MKSMSAKEAKNGFGLMLNSARAEPVTVHKHGRPLSWWWQLRSSSG